MSLPDILTVLVLFEAVPLNVLVTWRLWQLSKQSPGVWALRDRFVVALAVTVIVAIFALVFVNNRLEVPPMTTEQTMLVTRGTILALSTFTALYWLRRARQ